MKVFCFKCSSAHEEATKIPFRAVCLQCGFDLHICKTCRFYSPGKPNDCAMPGTDFVRDREAANFCEEYCPMPPPSQEAQGASEKAKQVFGEEPPKKKNPLLE